MALYESIEGGGPPKSYYEECDDNATEKCMISSRLRVGAGFLSTSKRLAGCCDTLHRMYLLTELIDERLDYMSSPSRRDVWILCHSNGAVRWC